MAKIEFVETTMFEGDVYIEIWSEDKHYSFLAEDVLDAMNGRPTKRAIDPPSACEGCGVVPGQGEHDRSCPVVSVGN